MTFEDQLAQLARLRTARRRADAGLQVARKQAAAIGSGIDELRRSGAASTDEIAQLEEAARQSQQRLRDARTDLAGRVRDLSVGLDGLSTLDDPTRLIERWDDRTPILLLPVRIETRFMPVTAPTELSVRIFPDDIAVHTREENPSVDGNGTGDRTWSRAPQSHVMPDRFVVVLRASGRPDKTVIGNQIPDPLMLGPDPSGEDAGIDRVDSEIQLSDELRWMHDFDEAVRVGMAIRVPLTADEVTTGFDRLFAVGLRLSSNPDDSRRLIEELLENHRKSPDGAALIPQGTPTNNTTDAPSGFRSAIGDGVSEPDGDPLFIPVDEPSDRCDAQWLAEALGIDYAAVAHLQNASRGDVREARYMNQALWPATLGYYLEQMLGVEAATVRRIGRFFVEHVSGRGASPAIRVGAQPYGVLLTSDWRLWRVADSADTASIESRIRDLVARIEPIWESASANAAFVGKRGDSHALLLDMLGLNATSVDYFRRYAVGSAYLWNYAIFQGWGGAAAGDLRAAQLAFARQILIDLGWPLNAPPSIADLSFFTNHAHIADPFIADVATSDDEILSEEEGIRRLYRAGESEEPQNYLGWLRDSAVADIKTQTFKGSQGEDLPIPCALFYRLMRHALLLANVDAALQLYETNGVVSPVARREVELPNVRADRTVTRWEFLEARVDRVLPNLSDQPIPVVEYLGTDAAEEQPAVDGLTRVREALAVLTDLPTARLERLAAEHIDLCSYRLDAWQNGLFTQRVRALRDPRDTGKTVDRALGLHLGAFGWLEEIRRGTAAVPVNLEDVPESLRDPSRGPIVEQLDSGGGIHGFSTNHAVAGAVLRNAYLTHASPSSRDVMSVDLSSERARIAAYFLDGIANGQPLGALLGYQFQRGLKERHGDPSLLQFVQNFRDAYPMRADKITPDAEGEDAALKEANNVFDGYALLERTLLAEPPTEYPYGVEGLPAAGSSQAAAIADEVDRMAWTMDAVADLALAEGVFQVTQGNFDRGAAMLRAISQGTHPPEPEILRTPRSGAAVNHRVALHLDPTVIARVWSSASTARSRAEPALNAWFAERIGLPSRLRFVVRRGPGLVEDADNSIADLDIEAIDLIHITGDELGNGESELVRRIRHAYRLAHGGADDPSLQTLVVEFPPRHIAWTDGDVGLFEAMPLISALKRLATSARPLGAGDYMLPSEDTTDPAVDPNPQRFDDASMRTAIDGVLSEFTASRQQLVNAIDTGATIDPVTATDAERAAALNALGDRLRAMSAFGFPDAFIDQRAIPPHSGNSPTPFERALARHLELGRSVARQAAVRLAEAGRLATFSDLTPDQIAALTATQKVERYREAARQLVGADFNLLPRFVLKNPDEVAAAVAFRDLPLDQGLVRHSADPMAVESWFQGAAYVRERLRTLETVATMGDAFGKVFPLFRPLQLPFRATDHWVAIEYPSEFRPVGDYLTLVQQTPSNGFDPAAAQTGLLVDAWSEVIPNRVETTGIAVHYNQPGAQPPQTLLLAVPPQLTGSWTWAELLGVVDDTLRRAKTRAAEPDHLQIGPIAQFVPAILTPTASRVRATISADLVHSTAVTFNQ